MSTPPKPNPSPEEMASTLTLQDTLQSIFGSEYSATSEVEDIRSVAPQSEKSLPSPLSSEENVQNAIEAKNTEGLGDSSQMSWIGKMVKNQELRLTVLDAEWTLILKKSVLLL